MFNNIWFILSLQSAYTRTVLKQCKLFWFRFRYIRHHTFSNYMPVILVCIKNYYFRRNVLEIGM